MSEKWGVGDVIDYYRFLMQEHGMPETERKKTRRDMFLASGLNKTDGKRRVLLCWLKVKRAQQGDGVNGAKVINRLILTVFFLGIVAGGGLAAVAVFTSLISSRTVSINYIFWLLFGTPLLLALLASAFPAISRFAFRCCIAVAGKAIPRLMGSAELPIDSYSDLLKDGCSIELKILKKLRDKIIHWWGIGCGLGVYMGLWFQGLLYKLQFSWGTTFSWYEQFFNRLIELAAKPLLWVSPDIPTISGLSGNGIQDNSEAWLGYLLWLILFYGVFARLIMLIVTGLSALPYIQRMTFDDRYSKALYHECIYPIVKNEGEDRAREEIMPGVLASISKKVLLVPKYLEAYLTNPRLTEHPIFSETVDMSLVSLDEEEDRALLSALSKRMEVGASIVLLQEGFRPFTSEIGMYIEVLRELIREQIPITVALIAKEDGLDESVVKHWKTRVMCGGPLRGVDVIVI